MSSEAQNLLIPFRRDKKRDFAVDEATLAAHRLEGHPRLYRRARIALEDGAVVETCLLAPEQVDGRPLVDSGNWRSRRKETAA